MYLSLSNFVSQNNVSAVYGHLPVGYLPILLVLDHVGRWDKACLGLKVLLSDTRDRVYCVRPRGYGVRVVIMGFYCQLKF